MPFLSTIIAADIVSGEYPDANIFHGMVLFNLFVIVGGIIFMTLPLKKTQIT